MTTDLKGKVFLVTGATDGIGRAAVTAFAHRGATITIVCRNAEKTEQVVAHIKAETGNPNIDYLLCDLSRIAEVKRMAEAFKVTHTRLDVLVNNAGAIFGAPTLGPDGYELTFTLNHLAYFQLTTSLLDLLISTEGARIVSTSSAMQARGKLDLSKTPTTTAGSGMAAYATSKLANILFTKELQKRLEGTSVVANCFHPGSVRTKFGAFGGTNLGCLINCIFWLARPFSKTAEQGADSLILLATSPEAAALKGQYISNRCPVAPSNAANDAQLAHDLWCLSEKLCASAINNATAS